MNTLREHLKLKRKHLTTKESHDMSQGISQKIIRSKWIREYSNVGIYHPVNGEANTLQLIDFMWSINQQIFLPMINKKKLLFGKICPDSKLKKTVLGSQNLMQIETTKYLPILLIWSLFPWLHLT